MKTKNCTLIRATTTRSIAAALALTATLSLSQQHSHAAVTVNLNSAASFAALAGSGITFAAPVNSTFITGDIGSFATTTITGLENAVIDGVNHAGDSVTQQAKTDLLTAYTDAEGRQEDTLFPLIHDVGSLTLVPGVYQAPSSLGITGVVTLDGGGDSNAVWIFQIGSTLITASGSSVNLINGAQASNIFWQVGTSATLGTGSELDGTILAQQSITLNTNAALTGRALALNGAVTFDNNIVAIPETSSTLLFALGVSLASLTRSRKIYCA